MLFFIHSLTSFLCKLAGVLLQPLGGVKPLRVYFCPQMPAQPSSLFEIVPSD